MSRLIRVRVCPHWRLLSFLEKSFCRSQWPQQSCWVHLVARNSCACPADWWVCFNRAEKILIGSNCYSYTIALVLQWCSVQCASACLCLSCRHTVCVFAFVCMSVLGSVRFLMFLVGWCCFCPVQHKVRCTLWCSCINLQMLGQRASTSLMETGIKGGEKSRIGLSVIKMWVKV